jgi:hypothetical protein
MRAGVGIQAGCCGTPSCCQWPRAISSRRQECSLLWSVALCTAPLRFSCYPLGNLSLHGFRWQSQGFRSPSDAQGFAVECGAESKRGESFGGCERRFDELEVLILYLDRVIVGEHHVRVAAGVDEKGEKHAWGTAEDARENHAVANGVWKTWAGGG